MRRELREREYRCELVAVEGSGGEGIRGELELHEELAVAPSGDLDAKQLRGAHAQQVFNVAKEPSRVEAETEWMIGEVEHRDELKEETLAR